MKQPLQVQVTIPPLLAERVERIQQRMDEHRSDGETIEGAIVRLVAIGVEEWERMAREDD